MPYIFIHQHDVSACTHVSNFSCQSPLFFNCSHIKQSSNQPQNYHFFDSSNDNMGDPSFCSLSTGKTSLCFWFMAFVISVSSSIPLQGAMRHNDIEEYLHAANWRNHKSNCDNADWSFKIVTDYNVSLVLTVDLKGGANFTSVQKAVNAAPVNSRTRILIRIQSGVYKEKVRVPANKPNLMFQGQGFNNTRITWDDNAKSAGGTVFTPTVFVEAPNFIAFNISFQNTAPLPNPGDVGAQAVALRIIGDQAAFYSCGFFGGQDTLHDDLGRHYYENCFIQGSIDIIFGRARSLFQNCIINSIAKESKGISGVIAAQGSQLKADKTGFSFVKCEIRGTGRVWLGRTWGVYSTIVYARTYMSSIIAPSGWDDVHVKSKDKVFFGEFECTGPGANFKSRVKYSKQLNPSEAAMFMNISYIDGNQWLLHHGNINTPYPIGTKLVQTY